MSLLLETCISLLLVIGGLFGLIGSFGLLKLKTPMQRLHAPTKATTLGVGATLLAAAIAMYWQTGSASWQVVMISVFLFLTAPVSALYLAKTHLHLGKDPLPPTSTKADWASKRR
jgi:multicomponent K+:H+ antiporter subunit G